MVESQPDEKKIPWVMIAGALVLLLVIYIFTGPYAPPPPMEVVPKPVPFATERPPQ